MIKSGRWQGQAIIVTTRETLFFVSFSWWCGCCPVIRTLPSYFAWTEWSYTHNPDEQWRRGGTGTRHGRLQIIYSSQWKCHKKTTMLWREELEEDDDDVGEMDIIIIISSFPPPHPLYWCGWCLLFVGPAPSSSWVSSSFFIPLYILGLICFLSSGSDWVSHDPRYV